MEAFSAWLVAPKKDPSKKKTWAKKATKKVAKKTAKKASKKTAKTADTETTEE